MHQSLQCGVRAKCVHNLPAQSMMMMMMMMIRAQLRIKLENCVCREVSTPIQSNDANNFNEAEIEVLIEYLCTCVLVEPVGCMFIICTL